MSRIGKLKVPLPEGVVATQKQATVSIKGPKGELLQEIHPLLKLNIDADGIQVEKNDNTRKADALSGMTRSLINNMVTGVSKGFSRELEIVGVGYRAEMSGKDLIFQLGYSHKITFPVPSGITAELPKPTQILLKGCDNFLLGQTAARIRDLRKPEPYKGKGIKYAGETIRRKVGKTGAK